jgi:hypothetical protein
MLIQPLQTQLERVKVIHQQDLQQGFGVVYLPYALERKYPNANREWAWQYVFPTDKRSIDPRAGVERRHHLGETALQQAVRNAVRQVNIDKPASFIPCAIALRRICWPMATISTPCRNY